MTKEVKIKPRCLTFPMTDPEHMPAAYTSDGYMLPCCWLDQPELDDDVKKMGLKEEHLAVKNNSKLEDIYSSIDNLFKNNKYLEYGKEAKINAEKFMWDRIIENYKRIL